jgi:hypothetical protein
MNRCEIPVEKRAGVPLAVFGVFLCHGELRAPISWDRGKGWEVGGVDGCSRGLLCKDAG